MSEKQKILFADDDPEIREVIRVILESEGFALVEAHDGPSAVALADPSIDLIILDVMMPGMSGISACTEIRKKTAAPILFLTARSAESDKTLGFSAGGDDYLSKPFSYHELLLRIRALLRRYTVYGAKAAAEPALLRCGAIEIDPQKNIVRKDGAEVSLTDLEYRILLLLAQNRHKVFSAQSIYENVWREPYYYNSNNTVMVHIRNLRRKLGDDPQNAEIIKNVWGRGYRLD
ncbi:MAG: response regulator transcription factor [Butyricicoccus sp.]|nr:response regulator transcription factor [Butyricicoccus sp.]